MSYFILFWIPPYQPTVCGGCVLFLYYSISLSVVGFLLPGLKSRCGTANIVVVSYESINTLPTRAILNLKLVPLHPSAFTTGCTHPLPPINTNPRFKILQPMQPTPSTARLRRMNHIGGGECRNRNVPSLIVIFSFPFLSILMSSYYIMYYVGMIRL